MAACAATPVVRRRHLHSNHGNISKSAHISRSETPGSGGKPIARNGSEIRLALEAWAIFSNHYHFVGYTHSTPSRLREFLTDLHSHAAREVNQMDGMQGRKVWHNFWDKRLTFEKSYLARLNYVHQNAVKHGLVRLANQYPWCSASWFERVARPSQVKTIYSFKVDRLQVTDEFEPLPIR
jgi:putative transposase